ncbi:MAG: prolipoprotein diacylglyceryl transferase [Candidatus Aminicenantia bacterium]
MFPVLIKIGPLTIHTYGFLMALGVLLGLIFIFWQAKKQELPSNKLADLAFYAILISLFGAKVFLFFGNFSYYTTYPKEILSMARSGGVFQGGLIFGFLFTLWFLKKNKLPAWKVADIVAPALALGHSIGRLGCFSAGCCYGRASSLPWGVTFKSEYAHSLTGIPINFPIHPTQLYEAILNFLNFLVLFVILKKKKFEGQVFALYLINYSIIRYFVEFYRGDHSQQAFLIKGLSPYTSLSTFQLICIIGFIFGIFLYRFLKKKKHG